MQLRAIMQLRILAIGKLKQPGLEALVDEYQQRARTLLPIELVHLRDLAGLRARAGRPRVVLDERGTQVDSEGLAQWIGDWRARGERRIDWLIGDAHGFDDADRQDADRVLALSKLTLPHRIAQLLLVEQLYRAGTILAGHPYHHA
ncbi:23S rRNA (pseudouridine(1915)-N(3))-methyltransferase RlmH [Nannocystaceae bacterium ST9]